MRLGAGSVAWADVDFRDSDTSGRAGGVALGRFCWGRTLGFVSQGRFFVFRVGVPWEKEGELRVVNDES